MKRLSICIPTFNRAKELRELLDALIPQITDEDVYVVADYSGDDTQQVIDEFGLDYEMHNPTIGPNEAFIRCIEHAKKMPAICCWILGDDELLHEGALRALKMQINYHAELAVCIPSKTELPDENPLFRNSTTYINAMLEYAPFNLLHQTIISGSIFNPHIVDIKYMRTADTDYAFVYGLMKGITDYDAPIQLITEQLYSVRKVRPLYSTWPQNIDRSLENYLMWLTHNSKVSFSRTQARALVKEFGSTMTNDLKNPLKFLAKHYNAIFSLNAWKFFLKRLAYLFSRS